MLTATGKLFFSLPPPVTLILSNPLLGTETGQKEGEGKDTKDERRRREGGRKRDGDRADVGGGEEGASFISLRYTQRHGATLTSISAPLAAASAGAALDRPDCVSAADLSLLHTR